MVASFQQSAQSRMAAGGGQGGHIDSQAERSIQAYTIINRFLQGFVDHVNIFNNR